MATQFIDDVHSIVNSTKCIALCAPNYVNRKGFLSLIFPEHEYIDMAELKNRMYFVDAPMNLMQNFKNKLILDNIQFCPSVVKFIGENINHVKNGQIVISVNYKIYETKHWTDELDKNCKIYELPIVPAKVVFELGGKLKNPIDSIITSNVPSLSRDPSLAFDFYVDFLDNFINSSVHLVHSLSDPLKVVVLLRALAARIGKSADLKELAETCDLSVPTVREWLKVLELFYIVFPVYPYTKNFGKRLKKSTVYQFYNSGLVCMLLNIRSQQDYVVSIFREELVRSICTGIFVAYNNSNTSDNTAYYWKESYGHKIDLLVESDTGLKGYIFSDRVNPSKRHFEEIARFSEISGTPLKNLSIIYPGDESMVKDGVQLISWKDVG